MDFQRFALAYTASIKSIDDSVGEMVATLEELELLDNTIIVYAGDNGMFLGEHGMTDKRSMHEPSIRVPLIVRYPARIRPGQVRDDLVLNVDVAPSILEWCDAEPLPNIHGQSFAGLLEDVSATEGAAAILSMLEAEGVLPAGGARHGQQGSPQGDGR